METLAEKIQRLGAYQEVRILPDGSIAALGELMFTRAVYLGCDELGWSRRFCFEDRPRANEEFEKLQSQHDTPTGWIARRPPQPEDFKDWP